MKNLIDNNIDNIEKRIKYIIIFALYFIFMFTNIIGYPLGKIMIEIIDMLDLEVEQQQFYAMFNFIFFAILTLIFILMLRRDLKDDLIKTKDNVLTHEDGNVENMNFFIQVLLTYSIYMLVSIIVAIIFTILPITQESSQNQDSIVEITTGGSSISISMILTVVFLGPFVEEIVFRLTIFKVIPHIIPAILLSSLIFAGIHIDFGSEPIYLILTYLPAGVALSLSYYYTKNIFVPIATHMGMNALAVMIMVIPTLFQ